MTLYGMLKSGVGRVSRSASVYRRTKLSLFSILVDGLENKQQKQFNDYKYQFGGMGFAGYLQIKKWIYINIFLSVNKCYLDKLPIDSMYTCNKLTLEKEERI